MVKIIIFGTLGILMPAEDSFQVGIRLFSFVNIALMIGMTYSAYKFEGGVEWNTIKKIAGAFVAVVGFIQAVVWVYVTIIGLLGY